MDFDGQNIPDEPVQQSADAPKSARELWMELGRLLLLLLWTIVKKFIRVTYKSVRLFIALVKLCVTSAREWWQDKSTQEKIKAIRAKIRHWCKEGWKYAGIGCRGLWHWTVIGSKALARYAVLAAGKTWKGTVWLCTNLIQLIIHTKPVLIRLGKAARRGYKQFRHRLKLMRRGIRLRRIRQKRRYAAFKRNGGMKGWLEGVSGALKSSIQSYMEEEQNEAAPDAITEDDIIEARFEELEQSNRAHIIGKKIFSSVKSIVEENE